MLTDSIAPMGAKALLVCSTGGHLSELIRLEAQLGVNPESLWVTFDTPQSRELLEGRRMIALPYIGPRDLKGTLRAMPVLRRALQAESFEVAVSTGAAVAVAALPLAVLAGVPATYVESVSRVHGPSSTGRILELVPGVRLRTPHPQWSRGRWAPAHSVLSDFRSVPAATRAVPRKVFVTLGTIRGYRFDSVVDAMLRTGYANDETVWQLGDTDRSDSLPGTVHQYMSPDDFARTALEADAVVTHAGVGTLLELLGMGIYPVQAVRRAHRREHVDDHQTEIARLVNELDIGVAVDGPELTGSAIERAASRRIVDGLRAGAA
ncbi:glycosyltransferase [Micromonospora sp. DT81.3]|uniref:glycosyltransferase n=1 Tax=Actinomycetes TaxID=1760 RepID=UPI003CF2521E